MHNHSLIWDITFQIKCVLFHYLDERYRLMTTSNSFWAHIEWFFHYQILLLRNTISMSILDCPFVWFLSWVPWQRTTTETWAQFGYIEVITVSMSQMTKSMFVGRSGAFIFVRLVPCCDVRYDFHKKAIRVMFYLCHLYLFSYSGV